MDWNSENEFFSSDENSYDSDVIDSDIEADLYSTIHHQQETSLSNSNEYSTSEDDKSNSKSKTNADTSDINGKTYSVNESRNSKNYNEVQNIEYQNELNCVKSTKRKSNEVNDLINNILPNTKKWKMGTTVKKNKTSECIELVNTDTSDDDSDVICLNSQQTEKQFQTNLLNRTITLDFSSDSNDSWYDRLSNKSIGSLSNPKSKVLWHVNNEDMYRFRRRSNRYHESELMNCSNCNQRGHIAKNCTVSLVMKCYICGKRHNPVKCKNQVCAKCFKKGHHYRLCKLKAILNCKLCNLVGHRTNECPDIWRRYHLTTSNKGINSNTIFQEEAIFCYNCGVFGHFGGNCMKRSLNMSANQTWPVVIDYAVPRFFQNNLDTTITEAEFKQIIAKQSKRKEKRILKQAKRKALQTQQNSLPKTEASPSKSNHLQTQQNAFPKTEASKSKLNQLKTQPNAFPKAEVSPSKFNQLKTQQNDFPRTPKNKSSSKKEWQGLSKQERQKKQQIYEEKNKEKKNKNIKQFKILRANILAQLNNISIPLLDLSGQSQLPYHILHREAKRERKQLRKLLAESQSSKDNISVS